MKITVFFLVLSILQLSARTNAQTITLNKVNAPLSDIFKAIRQQTDFDFVYSKKQISTAKTVTIIVKNGSINEVLKLCFQNQPFTYMITKQSIRITAKSKSEGAKETKNLISIKGRVINDAGDAISGATVSIENSAQSTTSDERGDFKMSGVDERAILNISFVGYETKKLLVKQDLEIIVLTRGNNKLDEVQVIGYGTSTQRYATGSISSISSKEIDQQPVTNVLSALSGRMPGVFVQTTNGLPGGNINIQIRGKGSLLAGTDPLYIIDGVPYEGNPPVKTGDRQINNYIGGSVSPLNNINPSEIETISVLKDADATSIYGSRATNGVVLITTKRAKAGKTRLNIDFSQAVSMVAQKAQLLSREQYKMIRTEAFRNDGIVPSADPTTLEYAPDLTLWNDNPTVDWFDYVFGNTAIANNLQSKISGGKGNTTFSVSGNYHFENTIYPGKNDYKRGGLTSQFNHTSENGRFKLSLSNQLTVQANRLSNIVKSIGGSFLLAPNYPLHLSNGSLNWEDTGSNLIAAQFAKSLMDIRTTLTSVTLSYRLLSEMSFKLNGGYTKTDYDQALIFPSRSLYPGSVNFTDLGKNGSESVIVEPQINYDLPVGPGKLSAVAGGTYQNRTNYRQFLTLSNFKLESLMQDLASAGSVDGRQSGYAVYRYASVFGRVGYNLLDTYLISGTLRRDGSSRFGPNNRYGSFGSIGAAWIFSNLSWVKETIPLISFGKLRGSYGTTGNDQISDYQYLSTYSSPGSNIYQGIATVGPSRVNNYDFHWETTRKTDFGVELGLLDDKLILTVDYYLNKSIDQLVSYNLPAITGFANYQTNLPAVVLNKGWEIGLNAKIIGGKKFQWDASFNVTIPKNELKSFANFEKSSYATTYQLGYDITRIKGYQYLYTDQQTGSAIYGDKDGNPSATPYNNVTLGKLTPKSYGGFGTNLSYGNLVLNIFAQFVNQASKASLNSYPGSSIYNNYATVLKRWTPENPNTNFPKATTLFDSYLGSSSLNIFNTSYLRLKNVSIAYTLPVNLSRRLGTDQVRLHIEGQNIFTIWNSKIPALDPESAGEAKNSPNLRSVAFGIQFTL